MASPGRLSDSHCCYHALMDCTTCAPTQQRQDKPHTFFAHEFVAAEKDSRYPHFAHAEMVVGMRRKYGRRWRSNFINRAGR